jgi:hypothetical protein
MIDAEILEKLQGASIEERINLIETILRSLKHDMQTTASPQSESTAYPSRPAFGFMKDTVKILGDVITPVLSENTWEALQ